MPVLKRKPSEAQIVKMDSPHGITDVYRWLCPEAVEQYKRAGWTVREEPREPTHDLKCQGFRCSHAAK